jgi:hypothetical protein
MTCKKPAHNCPGTPPAGNDGFAELDLRCLLCGGPAELSGR